MGKHSFATWDVETGGRMRIARVASGMGQKAVAHKLGCTYQAYQKFEKGTTKLSAHTAVVLSKLFKTDLCRLLGLAAE